MQIVHRNGQVTVKLTQAEGRRLRDSSYLCTNIAKNLTNPEAVEQLHNAAALVLKVADEFTPEKSKEKLDQQDAEQPPAAALSEFERMAKEGGAEIDAT